MKDSFINYLVIFSVLILYVIYNKAQYRIKKKKMLPYKNDLIKNLWRWNISYPIIFIWWTWQDWWYIENTDEWYESYMLQPLKSTTVIDSLCRKCHIELTTLESINDIAIRDKINIEKIILTEDTINFNTLKNDIKNSISKNDNSVYNWLEHNITECSSIKEIVEVLKKGRF